MHPARAAGAPDRLRIRPRGLLSRAQGSCAAGGRATIGAMDDDLPIPRDGKLSGWRLPPGAQTTGSPDTPDACPFCREETAPVPGALVGQASFGEPGSPEPWRETATCSKCGSRLARIPGDAWTGTTTL
jgi:hypothetical protein